MLYYFIKYLKIKETQVPTRTLWHLLDYFLLIKIQIIYISNQIIFECNPYKSNIYEIEASLIIASNDRSLLLGRFDTKHTVLMDTRNLSTSVH